MQSMVTTIDNPYDPFDQWALWFAFDTAHGYHTSSLLDRVVRTSDELSPTDQDLAIEEAVDEIVRENVLGIYRKVVKGSPLAPIA